MCVGFDCHSEWSCLQLQLKQGFVFDMLPFWQQIFTIKIGSYYKVSYISNVRVLESHFLFAFKRPKTALTKHAPINMLAVWYSLRKSSKYTVTQTLGKIVNFPLLPNNRACRKLQSQHYCNS